MAALRKARIRRDSTRLSGSREPNLNCNRLPNKFTKLNGQNKKLQSQIEKRDTLTVSDIFK